MLQDLDCSYCIIGHSERRAYHNESDDIITEKFFRLLENKITPILCVGESAEENANNQTKNVIEQQILRSKYTMAMDLNSLIRMQLAVFHKSKNNWNQKINL